MAAPKSSFGLLGCVSAIDPNGRTIWIADARRDDEKRLVVHTDEKLTGVFGTGIGGSRIRVATSGKG
jgi:hypothetical protein